MRGCACMYPSARLQGYTGGDGFRNRRSNREFTPEKWAMKQERLKRKRFRMAADHVVIYPYDIAIDSQVRARNRG